MRSCLIAGALLATLLAPAQALAWDGHGKTARVSCTNWNILLGNIIAPHLLPPEATVWKE